MRGDNSSLFDIAGWFLVPKVLLVESKSCFNPHSLFREIMAEGTIIVESVRPPVTPLMLNASCTIRQVLARRLDVEFDWDITFRLLHVS